ncbi:hypothetical protein C0991_006066 [Blastosporella zonata]|nr:hypothetical protein C0991_006066 [Blastosporella zonata]
MALQPSRNGRRASGSCLQGRKEYPEMPSAVSKYPCRGNSEITLTEPLISSSVLEKPVNFFPAKIDFPDASTAPTSALEDLSRHVRGRLGWMTHAGPWHTADLRIGLIKGKIEDWTQPSDIENRVVVLLTHVRELLGTRKLGLDRLVSEELLASFVLECLYAAFAKLGCGGIDR